jgi:hypothetical protein
MSIGDLERVISRMLSNDALDDRSTVRDLVGAHIASSEFKSFILLKSGLDWPPLFLRLA